MRACTRPSRTIWSPRAAAARSRDAPHSGTAGGAPCGDLIQIRVAVEGDRVADAGFEASGCGAAQAAGSAVVELIDGRPLLDAARLTAQDVSNELGGLSPGKVHAATLAADAHAHGDRRRLPRRRAASSRPTRTARSWP